MSRHIGNIIEEYARDTFNLVNAPFNDYHDAFLMNVPIEIKGVMQYPVDSAGRNKNGRVWIINDNHRELVYSKGMYLFVVYEYKEHIYQVLDYSDLNIRYVLFIAAHRIKINNGGNTKISYKKLLEMV